jgi:hypothetical protein
VNPLGYALALDLSTDFAADSLPVSRLAVVAITLRFPSQLGRLEERLVAVLGEQLCSLAADTLSRPAPPYEAYEACEGQNHFRLHFDARVRAR